MTCATSSSVINPKFFTQPSAFVSQWQLNNFPFRAFIAVVHLFTVQSATFPLPLLPPSSSSSASWLCSLGSPAPPSRYDEICQDWKKCIEPFFQILQDMSRLKICNIKKRFYSVYRPCIPSPPFLSFFLTLLGLPPPTFKIFLHWLSSNDLTM